MQTQWRRWFMVLLAPLACASTQSDSRARSSHYRDGQFHNLESRDPKSLWAFLRMRMKTAYADWPKWVESTPGKINPVRVENENIHVSVINHATALIQVAGLNILTDPIYSERCSPVSFAGPARVRAPGIAFEGLPPIDVVLVSHDHYDHLDLPTIEKLIQRDNPQFFVGLGVGERFPKNAKVQEMDWWDSTTLVSGAKINFVPVQHFSGRGLFDRNSTLWGGFVIEAKGRKIYFGGDTGYADHFKLTYEKFGAMDLALLPIGAYSPREFMGPVHMDPVEAVRAHLDLHARTSIGVHYGTFQLTAEAIDSPVKELREEMEKQKLPPSAFLTPEFGTVTRLD